MTDQKTEKTAEQIQQDKANAFDYGIGACLKKAGINDPGFIGAFMKKAHEVAAASVEQKV